MVLAFERRKLEKELARHGKEFVFLKKKENQYGEAVGDEIVVTKILGLFHEQSVVSQLNTVEGMQYRTKKIPMILCLYSREIEKIKLGDYVLFNGKRFNFVSTENINEWNLIADISLELVDNGN